MSAWFVHGTWYALVINDLMVLIVADLLNIRRRAR